MEYYIKNLNCAHCAGKIENEIGDLKEVDSCTLNFMERKLTVETSEDKNSITAKLMALVDSIEPGTQIVPIEDGTDIDEDEGDGKKALIKLVAAGVLFGISILLESNFYLSLAIGLVSYFLVGGKVVLQALKNIKSGEVFDENFLMTIASVGAYAIGEHHEGIAVMILYGLGEFLQDRAVDSSRKSIKSLVKMKPEYGNLVMEGEVKKVKPEVLEIGDIIRILPGEKIPVDGVVTQGTTTVDTSQITGESMPETKKVGDKVLSGSVNQSGVIECSVEKSFKNSTVGKILDMVENASSRKSKTENFITVFAKYYTPIVCIVAAAIGLIIPNITGDSYSMWIYRALIFLVISCPCAMVISIPLSYFAAIGVSSKHGILVKGSNYMEAMARAKAVVLDKTGTVTRGRFQVTNVVGDEKTIQIAKKLEENSNHPIGKSIREYYPSKVDLRIDNIHEVPGFGIKGELEGQQVYLGNADFLRANKIEIEPMVSNGTVLYLGHGNRFMGAIEIMDKIKDDAKKSIKALKNLGIERIVMLTGDRDEPSQIVAGEIGIDEVKSQLLPEDKVSCFEEIKKSTEGNVVFVGDGTNDAPVLRIADVGISMGEFGSDAAIESSDATIMGEELKKLPLFYKISKITRRIAIENIVFALGIKLFIMGLGVLGYANMWTAVFADVGVALLCILNSLRLMRIKNN